MNKNLIKSLICIVFLLITMSSTLAYDIGKNWTLETSNAPPVRDFGLLELNNVFYIIGGYNGTYSNLIYNSTDLVNWNFMGAADFSPRAEAAYYVYDNKLWVLSGTADYSDQFHDVWSSPDGITWTNETAKSNTEHWPGVQQPFEFEFDGKYWFAGGFTKVSEVWYSTNITTWDNTSTSTYPSSYNHAGAVLNGIIYTLGGYNKLRTVYNSTDGTTWVNSSPVDYWPGTNSACALTFDDKIWYIGGSENNDVWYSQNGATWVNQTQTAGNALPNPLTDMECIEFNNKIYIIGGSNTTENTRMVFTSEAVAATTATLNLSTTVPIDNSQYNTNFLMFNGTVNSTTDFNCSFILNSTNNQTKLYSSGNDVFVSFNLTFGSSNEQSYKYYFACMNVNDISNTTEYTFHVDNINPTIAVDSYLNSNRTIIYNGVPLITQINFTDDNLYAINISLDDTYILFNISALDVSSYIYNLTFRPEDYGISPGEHKLKIESADSHTANLIDDYSYQKNSLSKSIKYLFDKSYVEIVPTTNGLFSSFNTWKETDRYVFEYNRDSIAKLIYGEDMEFIVKSNNKIDIIQNSKYKGHLVIYGLKKWLDFENSESKDVILERVNDYEVKVKLIGVKNDRITFNSIGGLNVETKVYTFYYGTATETYVNKSLETQNMDFTLNFTTNSTYVNDISAQLWWNGTAYAATKTSLTNSIYFSKTLSTGLLSINATNVTFYWNFTIENIGLGNNITNVTNSTNQSIYRMIISNCSNSIADTTILNFTTRDEKNSNLLSTTTEALFTYWNRTTSLSRTTPMVTREGNNHSFCIYPDWAVINANYEIEFSASGYESRKYIKNLDSLFANSSEIVVYLLDTTNSTAIDILVVDQNDNELSSYVVEAWKYNLGTNTYTLIDTKTTDGSGECRFYLDVSSNEYEFRVKDTDGELVHTEAKKLLIDTSYTLRVILGSAPESIYMKLKSNLDYDLTVDRINRNFTFRWDDYGSLITQSRLVVTKGNVTDTYSLSDQTSTLSEGALSFNVSDISGLYYAKAYVTSSDDGAEYLLDVKTLDIKEEWDMFGTESLFASFFFIGTMIFAALAFGGEAALIVAGVGFIMFRALGFINVSWEALIGIVVGAILILVRIHNRR